MIFVVIQGGKVREGMSGKVLKPSKLDISQSLVSPQSTEPKQPVKYPPMLDNSPKSDGQHNG